MLIVIDYNGKLAVTTGWAPNWEKPEDNRLMWISDIDAQDHPHLVDVKTDDVQGNTVTVYFPGRRPAVLDTQDWEKTVEIRPVKKPRRGKKGGWAYDWEWHNGRWEKVWV